MTRSDSTAVELRRQVLAPHPVSAGGRYVVYWMVAARRLEHNFALDYALAWCRRLDRPLVILEALRCGYRWASDRLHRFVLEGMADNARRAAARRVRYYPYVELEPGHGRGLLEALARDACLVVSDDYPSFFVPRMQTAAAARLDVRLETVDSNGLLPLRAAGSVFPTAYAFRRFLQRELPQHLDRFPLPDPLDGCDLPAEPKLAASITSRWPPAQPALLAATRDVLGQLPIDHGVRPAAFTGGATVGRRRLARFVAQRLPRYGEDRNHPDDDLSSGLSPYLHFGHLSAHEIFLAVVKDEGWTPARVSPRATGSREGWWNLRPEAEAFLDELITWRELGFNFAALRDDGESFESLPDWARATLSSHARDPRPHTYTLEQFEAADTFDPLWNAAQRQLVREGRLHNYLRMLWGKKILEWSSSPREAMRIMFELNNKYAVDGRDPNSVSGIGWVLGRYDRPWGPSRPIFGTVRYMSSENTARKLRVARYLARHGG